MKPQEWAIFGVVTALTAGTALFLASFKSRQKLGPPGVKVVAETVWGESVGADGRRERFVAGTNAVCLPERVLDYESQPLPVPKIVYDWLPKDTTYGQRLYTAPDGFTIQNTVVLMGRDRTSIHEPEHCLVGSGWTVQSAAPATIQIERPVRYPLAVTRLLARRQLKNERGEPMVVHAVFVYWFVAHNELAAAHLKRLWQMARDVVRTGTLQRWAYVAYLAVCPPGAEEATFARLAQFIAASAPEFQLVPAAPAATPASGAGQGRVNSQGRLVVREQDPARRRAAAHQATL